MSQTDKSQTSCTVPLISIYIPTKNRLALLKRAINSVFAQTHPNIGIHIVNDGSTDGTKDYLNELALTHNNVYVVHNEISIGACAARNIAINNAKGEFITGLDDDDELLPERLTRLLAAYNDKYAFVCSSMWWDYGKKKRLIDTKQGIITLTQQLSYNEATTQVLVKRDRVIAVGGFDENFVACQDYDLWTRLIIAYGPAYRIGHASYVVNDTATTVRMIGDPKSVKGYDQYFEKHAHLMTKVNKNNQAFMRLRRLRQPMPLEMLIMQLGSGHIQAKIRYYLSSNFQLIKRVSRWLYKQ